MKLNRNSSAGNIVIVISSFRYVTGLDTNTLYYFALRTADEESDLSNLSNVSDGTT